MSRKTNRKGSEKRGKAHNGVCASTSSEKSVPSIVCCE